MKITFEMTPEDMETIFDLVYSLVTTNDNDPSAADVEDDDEDIRPEDFGLR